MRQLLFSGGTFVDGARAHPFRAAVPVAGDRIRRVEAGIETPAALRVDGAGRTLAPGVIDSHTHSDLHLIEERTDKLRLGLPEPAAGRAVTRDRRVFQ